VLTTVQLTGAVVDTARLLIQFAIGIRSGNVFIILLFSHLSRNSKETSCFSIVWTPIHPITWFFPFVGHMGICDSRGICFDFTGAIGVDDLAFGSPTRYIVLDPKKTSGGGVRLTKRSHVGSTTISQMDRGSTVAEQGSASDEESSVEHELDEFGEADTDDRDRWDHAVLKSSKMFEHRMHLMLCGNDCHSHCAVALNLMAYDGWTSWNKVVLAAWIFFRGRHTSWWAVFQTWFGTFLVLFFFAVRHFIYLSR
jgi:transmembrane protein 222